MQPTQHGNYVIPAEKAVASAPIALVPVPVPDPKQAFILEETRERLRQVLNSAPKCPIENCMSQFCKTLREIKDFLERTK